MTSSSPSDMVAVYELRRNRRFIEQVQEATLHRDDAGIVPEHGLFGSDEWWVAIADGRFPTHTIRGRISKLYMSGHNDFAEFEVDDGVTRTSWAREGDDTWYEVGRSVQIDYVLTRFKRPITSETHGRTVLRILVGV